jgi:ParB-like chromosome segregation protein Spo0J
MAIEIKCKSDNCLAIDELSDFQGNLKFRTVTDLDRITDSILRFGFLFPFFVWRDGETNNIIDGHGRLEALQALQAKGHEIPPLPVVYIKAQTRDEAKNLLLRVNSLYGQIDRDELLALIAEAEADVGDLSFPTVALDLEAPETGGAYEPSLDPDIDTGEVGERDIRKAEDKLADIGKEHEFLEFNCRDCGARIYVKRETAIRYLKGEAV